MQKIGILDFHRITVIASICFFVASVQVCSAYSKTDDNSKTTALKSTSCAFPEEVREGLHPCQYYALAKYYLGNFNLEKAKLCVQRLHSMKSNKEAAILAEQLEKSFMPQFPVSEEAMKEFKAVIERKKEVDSCQDLTVRFPNFEWPYLVLAWNKIGSSERIFQERSPFLIM